MAEQQATHRQELETAVVNGNILSERIGQISGFIISMSAIWGGVWLIAHDKNTQGFIAILGALGSLVGIFVYGRWQQKAERQRKAQDVPAPQ
jgi:hypothetical protein